MKQRQKSLGQAWNSEQRQLLVIMPNRARKINGSYVLAALALAMGHFCAVRGATLDVGGSGPFRSIQQAVDAAQPGDVLRVAAGTYLESVVIRKSLTILGGFDSDHTTQSLVSYPTRILARATSETVTLSRPGKSWLLSDEISTAPRAGWLLVQGPTIRRIHSVSPAARMWQVDLDRDEGVTTGIACLVGPRDVVFRITDEAASRTEQGGAAPMHVHLDGVVIAGGLADGSEGAAVDSGGGIHLHCRNQATFFLTHCELAYNSAARRGGALWIEMSDLAECRITSNIVTRNSCSGSTDSAGGGLAFRLARGAELLCSDNQITENWSSGEASGLDIEAEWGCYVKLADNLVASNTAWENAGGLAARLGLMSLFESVGNEIETNHAVNGSCGGGYIELWGDSRAWLTGDRLLDNRCGSACGGLDIWAEGESQFELSAVRLSNNEAQECGGLSIGAASASAIVLSNLDVTSNRATAGETGGLVGKAQQDSQIEMTTVTIAANFASRDCGGFDLVAERSSGILLVRCDISGNQASDACGGGRLTGIADSLVECRNCQFTNNRANDGSNGVGSFNGLDGSRLRLIGCHFLGNRSAADSGVGSLGLAQESSANLTDCRFHDNLTSGSGGVGFIQAVDLSSFTLRRCEILRNESTNGSYGGFCAEGYFGSSLNFVESLFADNQSSGPFAALYVYGDDQTSVTMTRCQLLRNRSFGGDYGACAIAAVRDSPVWIHATTVAENMADGDHGGLSISVAEGSPLAMLDCRIHHNVALRGNGGALTVSAEGRSAVSLVATHCWANRAYGDAGAVWIAARDDSSLAIEDCDWYGNIAWNEQTEQVVLEEAGDRWRMAPLLGGRRESPFHPEPGDLITQGSLTWALGEVQSDGTSAVVRLVGRSTADPPPKAGPALFRRVGGDAGAFVIDQRGGGTCLLLHCRVWQNRAGHDYGAGTLTVLDSPDVQVRECSFSENVAGRDGGATGLWFAHVDRVHIGQNAFLDNRAGSREDVPTGGFCGGLDLYASDLRLLFSGNSIRGNRAFRCGTSGGNWGGGLLEIEEISLLEFLQNEIRGNRADADAGGFEIGCHDLSSAVARDNLIADNRAGRDFGGLVVGAGILSPIMLEKNEFRSNRALACGGGLALRSCRSSEGYIVTRNQFSRNTAPTGSAAFVMGPATFQNNLVTGNLNGRTGTIAIVATDATFANETLADNQGVAIATLGGAIHLPARIWRRGESGRDMFEIEATSPSLDALLLCARHLPVYLAGPPLQPDLGAIHELPLQGQTAYRILEAQLNPTTSVAWLHLEGFGRTGFQPVILRTTDDVTTGESEIATEARWPINLKKTPQGWQLVSAMGESSFRPEPGQHIVQGETECVVVEVSDKSPAYFVTLKDDTDLGEGEAILAAPPPMAPSLRVTNSIVWGSANPILAVGDTALEVSYCDLQGSIFPLAGHLPPFTPSGGRPGPGNISANPRFVAPPKDYRLASGSPAIDVGTSVGVPRIDLMGTVRPLDGNGDGYAVWDLGAYETLPEARGARGQK